VNSSSSLKLASRKLARLAAIGALVASLGLAGCGRKAGLDPPPSAAITTPAGGAATNNGQANNTQAEFDPVTGKPIAPGSVGRKTHFLDFLID
jgi:predicted small lipoprotein YifL